MSTMVETDAMRRQAQRAAAGSWEAAAPEAEFSRSNFSVLVVDPHEIVGVGFRLLLGSQPWVKRCIHATTAEKALEYVRRYQLHVALVAAEIADFGEAALIDQIRAVSPDTRTLLMLNASTVSSQTLRSVGACGFVSKLWSVQDSVAVVRAAGLGLEFAGAAHGSAGGGVDLSAREHDVLTRIAMGGTNREIADDLYLSPHTVKQHASAAFRKIGARNRTEAVERARRIGLIA